MAMTLEEIKAKARVRRDSCSRVKQLLVDRLSLNVDPNLITDDQPLFGRGLELDSIDSLELVVAIQEEFGVAVTDDNFEILVSINRLVDFLEANQA